jgi:hypothetical protein
MAKKVRFGKVVNVEKVDKRVGEALLSALIDFEADYVYVVLNHNDQGWQIGNGRPRPEPQQFRDFLALHREHLEALLDAENILLIWWNQGADKAGVQIIPCQEMPEPGSETMPFEEIELTLPRMTV